MPSSQNGLYRKSVLPNGLAVVTQTVPHVRSCSLGVLLKTGSRDEGENEGGLSHFVEHLLFKSCRKYGTKEIARIIDSLGGNLGASTGEEETCYTAWVLSPKIGEAIELYGQMIKHCLFKEEEIETERQVILEEIKDGEDSPEDSLFDFFAKCRWSRHPLGRPILGAASDIKRYDRKTIVEYHRKHYTGGNLLIAAAGDLEHERILDLAGENFGELPAGEDLRKRGRVTCSPQTKVVRRDLQQIYLCFGTRGLEHTDDRRYAAYLLNSILGGGVGSRLNQVIREQKGLAYTVSSFLDLFEGTGVFGVYASTGPGEYARVIELILEECEKIKKVSVDKGELARAKECLISSILLGRENTEHRMSDLAEGELLFNRYVSIEEELDSIGRVSQEDIRELAGYFFCREYYNLALMGNLGDRDLEGLI